MAKPKALILRTAGTNCDWETAFAFELAGAKTKSVHINQLIKGEVKLKAYNILAIPGGFSYGDDIASGKILANEIKYRLNDMFLKFASSGKPMLGICNGFQVLVKMGLLPSEIDFQQKTTLTYNDSGKFECRWINLKINQKAKAKNQNFWLKDMPEIFELPVAHGEGKFVTGHKKELLDLEHNNQVLFQYVDDKGKTAAYPYNPNGAVNGIAGICNEKGNILGMMPHPERSIYKLQSAFNRKLEDKNEYAWGLQIFKNAVNYIK